tara:strand:+ start:66 stop:710 length:645 start_codon:yes stop_codon:yes gene_type:complete
MDFNTKYCAIIDYGMGNLFSVKNACTYVGLSSIITSKTEEINEAAMIILPGVGAFSNAMDSLQNLNLVDTILNFASSGKPVIGICLGMQLLFEKSYEFGEKQGLGLIKGDVLKFDIKECLRVPHIGWNSIVETNSWDKTFLKGSKSESTMYFVHSFFCNPLDESVIVSKTKYGKKTFCSSLVKNNITGVQFHPEKSANQGLLFYQNLKEYIYSL